MCVQSRDWNRTEKNPFWNWSFHLKAWIPPAGLPSGLPRDCRHDLANRHSGCFEHLGRWPEVVCRHRLLVSRAWGRRHVQVSRPVTIEFFYFVLRAAFAHDFFVCVQARVHTHLVHGFLYANLFSSRFHSKRFERSSKVVECQTSVWTFCSAPLHDTLTTRRFISTNEMTLAAVSSRKVQKRITGLDAMYEWYGTVTISTKRRARQLRKKKQNSLRLAGTW